MQVQLDWVKPLALYSLSEEDLEKVRKSLDTKPGIYVFAREYGGCFEALYIGKAGNLCSRLKTQFNNRKLIDHVRTSKRGSKVLLIGYLKHYGYTNIEKSLSVAERAYIRWAVAQKHFLHNTHGTQLKTDEILSTGGKSRTLFPKQINVEV